MTRIAKQFFVWTQLAVLILAMLVPFSYPLKVQAHNAGAPNTTTIHYRWRDDTAALNTNSGWLAAQDTSYSGSTNTVYRLRFEISNEGTAEAKNITYGLEYATKSGGTCGDDETYGAVSTATTVRMDSSGQFADQDAVTASYLTGESTTFVNGIAVESVSTATGNITLQADEYTEVEFALKSIAVSATTYCIRLTNVDTTSVEAEITVTPPSADLSWATGAADFEIWESSSTTWDAGTKICSGTLTDNNASTITCNPSSIAASTQYRVQVVLQNDSVTQATMYSLGGSLSHVAVKGGWAGTSPTLGACAFNDLGADDNGTPVCSVTFSTNDVVITNTGTLINALIIGASGGQQGFSYLITTDTDPPTTDSTSYMDATEYNGDTENSSKITISGPTTEPTGTITSATADTDGTGGVVVVTEIDDPNDDDTKLKLEYATLVGLSCGDDETWSAATITGSVTADFNDSGGAPDVNNLSAYQIGSTATTRVITSSGSNTVTFEWDSATDVASGNGTYCLQLTANDDTSDQTTPDTQTVIIDNVGPTFTGSLTDGGRGYNYITYTYGSSATDTNEPGTDAYNMYYKAGTSGVTTGDTEHDDTDFNAYDYAAGTDTTVSSLSEDAQYVANIWANDTFGNQTAATEINLKTRVRPTGSINSAAQKTDGTGVVDISVEIDSGDNRDTRIKVEYETNGSGCDGPWAAATLTGTATADFNDSGGAPDISNSNTYQVGSTATTRVITSSGSNTITFDWDTQTDLPYASGTHCIRITANDDLYDQATPATQTLTIDNVAPSAPGNLTDSAVTANSVTLSFGSQSSDSGWWNSSWLNRMKLSFDNSSTAPETLTNFPVMVGLTSSNIDFAKVLANGADLRFVDADNSTELDYEIEDWDEAGTSVIWVRVPSIATGNSDYIYLYYNNTGASDNQNANGVWTAYDSAFHLNEAPADDTNAFVDSAGNGISGRAYNLSDGDGGSSGATGYLAGGVLFEPTDDFVQFATSGEYTTSFTASLWTYLNDLDCTNQDDVLMHRDAGGTSRGWKILQECGSLSLYLSPNGSTPYTTRYSTSNLTATTWHNVVTVYDSVNQAIQLYIDGNAVGGDYFNGPVPTSIYATPSIASSIGLWGQGNVDGYFDEIRLAGSAQSAAWVEAQYKSMSDTFVTFGSEESEPSGNFSTYKIFYKAGASGVTTSDTEHSDADLGFVNYNSTADTTVSSLSQTTAYVFNIWAYDSYGNVSNAVEVSTTTKAISGNTAPTSTIVLLNQKNTGSGTVDITITVDDDDGDTAKSKIEYVAGGACTGSWLDPTLVGPVGVNFDAGGTPDLNNAAAYQIGSTNPIYTTPVPTEASFDWDASTDLPTGDGTYCVRLTTNDNTEDQSTPYTRTLLIDNVAPTFTSGSLSVDSVTPTSVTLTYGSSAIDTNEPSTNAYKIFYKAGTSGVTIGDTEWDSVDLDAYNYGGNSSITITGLAQNTDYVFNIWAYDTKGNSTAGSEVTTKTELEATRVTEYYITDFSGTDYSLLLDQDLAENHFILIRGSGGSGTRYGPEENYVRVSELPSGTNGSITATSSSNRIGFSRKNASLSTWTGVVTVVEALADFSGETFRTIDVLEIPMGQLIDTGATQSGTATSSVEWSDSTRLVPFGGIRGSGIESEGGNVDTELSIQDGPSGFLRLYPQSGSTQLIDWTRWNINSRGLEYATATVHLIEFGSNWTVQHIVWDRWGGDGTLNGGPGADEVSEYSTKAISSVTRANTWVWNTGQGGGDSGASSYHGNIVTLGDGVNESATESTIAIGQAVGSGTTAFHDIYIMEHADAAVDYRWVPSSGGTDLTDTVTVDSATSGNRFAWMSSSVEANTVQTPFEMLSARYTADTSVELERLHHNSTAFMGWLQGIDFSGLGYTPGTYAQSGEFISSAFETDAFGTVANRQPLTIQWGQSVPAGCLLRVYLRGTNTGPSGDFSSSTWDWSYSSSTATTVSEDLSQVSALANWRFLQYRVYMESCSSGGNTPSLLDLFIDFD